MADINQVRELLRAASEGDLETLCNVEPDLLDVCNDEGNTLLMSACANGKETVARHLLKFNVKIDATNHYGWTALMQACYYGHTAVVGVLLDRGADVNLMNSWGVRPLLAATQSGNTALVKMLIQHKASLIPSEDSPTRFTPLMAAAQNGHEGVAAVLLNNGYDPNFQLAGSKYTALMFAALNGHISLVRLLLKHGADKEMESSFQQKAVDIAGAVGREDIAKLLGYSKVTKPSPVTPWAQSIPDEKGDIFAAVQSGDRMLQTVQRLLSAAPKLVNAKDSHGATPLMYAAMKGSIQMCRLLLTKGANVDTQDSVSEWTAFMQAVHHGQYIVAKQLLDHSADISIKSRDGCTAAEIATCNGDMKMLQLIMQHSRSHGNSAGKGSNTHESLHHWMAKMNEKLGNLPSSGQSLLHPDVVQITPRNSPTSSPVPSPGPVTHSSLRPIPNSSPSSTVLQIDPLQTIHEEEDSSHQVTPTTRPVPPSFSISPSPQIIVERVSNAFKDTTSDTVENHMVDRQNHKWMSKIQKPPNIEQAFELVVAPSEKKSAKFPPRHPCIDHVTVPATTPIDTPITTPVDTSTATPTEQSATTPTNITKNSPTVTTCPSLSSTSSLVSQDTPTSLQPWDNSTSLQSEDTPTPQKSQNTPTLFNFTSEPFNDLKDLNLHQTRSMGEILSLITDVKEEAAVTSSKEVTLASPDKTKRGFHTRKETNFTEPPSSVEDVLKVLDLQTYLTTIQDNEIDLETFLTMSDEDLEDIGIENAGHRLKLINAILKLNRTMNPVIKSDRLVYSSTPKLATGYILL